MVKERGDAMKTGSGGRLSLYLKSLVALLLGALVPALVVALFSCISLAKTRGADPDAPPNLTAYLLYLLSSGAIVFLFAFVFTAAAAFILGLPLALLGIRFRLIRWWSCLLVGFLIGFLPSLWASWPEFMNSLTVGGGLGILGGLTSWLVWHFWAGRHSGAKSSMPGQIADSSSST